MSPTNNCTVCTPATATGSFSNVASGTSCFSGSSHGTCDGVGSCIPNKLLTVSDTFNATEGGASGKITLLMDPGSTADTVVSYTVGGTAVQGTDYATIGSVVFPSALGKRKPGPLTYNVTIVPLNNSVLDVPDLYLTFTLMSTSDVEVDVSTPSVGTVYIIETDTTDISISTTSNATLSAARGLPGAFVLSVSIPINTDVVVSWHVVRVRACVHASNSNPHTGDVHHVWHCRPRHALHHARPEQHRQHGHCDHPCPGDERDHSRDRAQRLRRSHCHHDAHRHHAQRRPDHGQPHARHREHPAAGQRVGCAADVC